MHSILVAVLEVLLEVGSYAGACGTIRFKFSVRVANKGIQEKLQA